MLLRDSNHISQLELVHTAHLVLRTGLSWRLVLLGSPASPHTLVFCKTSAQFPTAQFFHWLGLYLSRVFQPQSLQPVPGLSPKITTQCGMPCSSSRQHPDLRGSLTKYIYIYVTGTIALVSQEQEGIYSFLSVSCLIYFLYAGNLANKSCCSRTFEKHHLRSMCLARPAQQTTFTGTILKLFSRVCAIPCSMSKINYVHFPDCNVFRYRWF